MVSVLLSIGGPLPAAGGHLGNLGSSIEIIQGTHTYVGVGSGVLWHHPYMSIRILPQ